MELCFNTTGPCFPDEHYMLPLERRLGRVMEIIDDGRYFTLHAGRQTGRRRGGQKTWGDATSPFDARHRASGAAPAGRLQVSGVALVTGAGAASIDGSECPMRRRLASR